MNDYAWLRGSPAQRTAQATMLCVYTQRKKRRNSPCLPPSLGTSPKIFLSLFGLSSLPLLFLSSFSFLEYTCIILLFSWNHPYSPPWIYLYCPFVAPNPSLLYDYKIITCFSGNTYLFFAYTLQFPLFCLFVFPCSFMHTNANPYPFPHRHNHANNHHTPLPFAPPFATTLLRGTI